MPSEKNILPFQQINRNDTPFAGGKGANLGDMVQAGLPVPPGYVICSAIFRRIMQESGVAVQVNAMLKDLDNSNIQQVQGIEAPIRALVESIQVPEDVTAAILEAYHTLGTDALVAVRSSSTAEDLSCASFAGQQETFLNIRGDDALLNAVRRCWSSLFTSQAIYYRCHNGFDHALVSMAVVVQKMVNSEKSGVIFTVDPVTRNPYAMILEGVWGLGEGIVSGSITPDHYKVDRDDMSILFNFVAPQTRMYVKGSTGGVEVVEVPPDQAHRPVLSEDEICKLVTLGNLVEKHFGSPQDIEWGFEAGELYLLQSRPITSL